MSAWAHIHLAFSRMVLFILSANPFISGESGMVTSCSIWCLRKYWANSRLLYSPPPSVFSTPTRSPLSPVTFAWNSWNINSVSLLWAIKYTAQDLEKSSTKVTMYFLPELEAVCIGPHTSECTFSNCRLERISPRGFSLCLGALPAHSPHRSSEAQLSSGLHLTHHS